MAKTNYMRQSTCEASDLLRYQSPYRRALQASDALMRLYRTRTRAGIAKDALWEGYYACKCEAAELVERAMRRGCLLTVFYDD